MHIIDSTLAMKRTLDSSLDEPLKRLLVTRRDQLMNDTDNEYDLSELATFIVVEPGDALSEIETAAGYPVVTEGAFEWVQQHRGWIEAAAILSDDGFGIVLYVPDDDRIDATLLSHLRSEIAATLPSIPATYEADQPVPPLS